MKEAVGYSAKRVSDLGHKELKAPELYEMFEREYLNPRAAFDIGECHYKQINGIIASVEVAEGKKKTIVQGEGNGRLDAVSNALKKHFGIAYTLIGYEQHALTNGSFAQAISYIGVEKEGKKYWGAGIHSDIIRSSVAALVSALNNYFNCSR